MMPKPSLHSSLLASLFSSHHPWLLGRLRAHLRHGGDAEDMAAETFCQLLASKVDPVSIVEPRAYLTTIANRLLFHARRRQALEQAWLERQAQRGEEFAPSAQEQAELLEAIIRIDAVLDGLPMAAKKAFLYNLLDDMGYDEIASRLGVSVRTVGRYMKQALRQCWRVQAA